jgi:hypothetical protein
VKKLIPNDEDAWAVFEAIRNAKHNPNKSVLLELSQRLENRYARYSEHRMNLERIPDAAPAFEGPQREALEHCYRRETIPLRQLKQRIEHRQSATARSKCQYCGIDSPITWDHYLPQAAFPEFAVYPDNLVPCCPACNWYRRDYWRMNGERVHLNLYFDEIEVEERFLVARIVFDQDGEPGATFEVDCSRGTNHAFARRYLRHCDALTLLDRFAKAAPAHLARMALKVRHIAALLAGDVNEIARHLKEEAEDLRDLLGANNWEVALGMAAAESREFIEYCLRPLPEHGEVST